MEIQLRSDDVTPVDPDLLKRKNALPLLMSTRQYGIFLSIPRSRYLYTQWSLQGDDWTPLSDANTSRRSAILKLMAERRTTILQEFDSPDVTATVFTVPDDKFIVYRPNAASYDIGLMACGYVYSEKYRQGEAV